LVVSGISRARLCTGGPDKRARGLLLNEAPQPPSEAAPAATPAERLHGSRYVLALALAALAAGTLFWDVPLLFLLMAAAALLLVASFVPRRRVLLSQSEERRLASVWPDTSMKATVEAFPRPSILLDVNGVVRYANRRAQELFPATRPGDAFVATFRWPEIAQAVKEAQAGMACAVDYHEPGEARRAYSVTFAPMRGGGQVASFILVTLEDVSDRLAVARMRSDFVANASHELRTPLASLTGFIETLLGPARNDPKASERFLLIMLDQAQRMRRLLDDLLSLSRVEMRAHRRPTDRVDLTAVIRHVADAMAPLAREFDVALSVDTPADAVEVIGDRDELVQVLGNLVENAIRYGASGKRVEIDLAPPRLGERHVSVSVRDYGPGIAAEHLPRLTERFYRVETQSSPQLKGTGLGLAIVKHIVTRHQGELAIDSEPGRGARFTVVLPLPNISREMPKTAESGDV